MVSGDLVRLFASRGIRPIPMAIGAQYCLDVLTRRVKEEPELVITTSLAQIAELGHSEIQDATRQPPTEENAATEQTVA